jgi:hypothetical protein
MSSALRASSKADLRGELRRGSEVFYLRLAGRTLNLMTKAEVSLGEAGGHSFSVQVDSASHLVAAGEDAPDSFATLLLNKDSGYAVWSRSRSTTLLGGDAPEVQAVYFVCR